MTELAARVAALAEAHAAAWRAGDLHGILALFDPQAELSVNGGEPYRGHDGIADSAAALMAQFSPLSVTCNGTRHAGSRAVFLWTLAGRNVETGRDVCLPGWHEWELTGDGKVFRCRGFYDADDLKTQIGSV